MSDRKRVKIGNALSKVNARLALSGSKGSVEEAIIHGDFFTDDYAPLSAPVEAVPSLPRKRGRPRNPSTVDPAKTSVKVPGVFRVGNTLKTRVQIRGQRMQVDLKTNKWEVARERKGKIDGMFFEGKFFGKCPPITLEKAWEQFKATQRGQVEDSTFSIYMRTIESHVIPLFGNMHLSEMDNKKVALLINDYQGIPVSLVGATGINTSEIEILARLYGHAPDGCKPWKPNATHRNKGGANLLLGNLKNFFYWCLEYGLIDKMPFTNQKLPHHKGARPYVSFRQIQPFLEAIKKRSKSKDLVLACRMGILLGLRSDEIRRSEWWWIDFDAKTFTPRDTKGKECTAIPIPPCFMKTFREEFQSRGEPLEDLIFPRTNQVVASENHTARGLAPTKTKPIARLRKRGEKRPESELRPKGFLSSIVRSAGRDIMKHGLTPHRLRATFATLHALAGTPIRDIQAMLRHKHIGTTIIYIEDIPEIRHMAQSRMEKLAGFGESGLGDVQSLRSWSDDLASFLRNASPSIEADNPEGAGPLPDSRLILTELAVYLERLVNATKAA